MEKIKKKIFALLICLVALPVLLLGYLSFVKVDDKEVAGKDKIDLMIEKEKNLAIAVTSKNAWYVTSLLRKVEVTGRIVQELAENIFRTPNSFVNQSDYKNEKTNSVLFISSEYKTVSHVDKLPVITNYFNNIFKIAGKNNPPINSMYIMTEVAVRKYPWEKLDDLIKAGLFYVGSFKVKSDSIFSKEETSPYEIVGPKNNKAKTEMWTTPFWSNETKSWLISYYAPIYVKNSYKGVIGFDISINKIMEILLGEGQTKKFIFENSYPIVVSKDSLLVGSSSSGYENLKIEPYDISSSNLLNYGSESFKSAISKMTDPKLWSSPILDNELGGLEKVYINNKENYIFYFPIGTANLTLGIISSKESVEKTATSSLCGSNVDVLLLKRKITFGSLIIIILTIILTTSMASIVSRFVLEYENTAMEKAEEIANIKIKEEKEPFDIKISELQTQNLNLQKTIDKLQDEIKQAISTVEIDKNKYVPIGEVNDRLEIEKRNYITNNKKLLDDLDADKKTLLTKMNEVQNVSTELQDTLNKLKSENEGLTNKVKSLEEEGRNLTYKLISKFEEEKKSFSQKIDELTRQLNNSNSKNQELELKIKSFVQESQGANMSTSENQKLLERMKLIEERKLEADRQIQKLLLKFEEEKKNLNLKIEELVSKNLELETEKDKELEVKQEEEVKETPKEEVKNVENNILVVDDQGEIVKIFGDMLYNIGYSVYIARNNKIALQKLAIGDYKYVILNTNISTEDYKEFYENLKKADSNLEKQIVFFVIDESKEPEFFKDKKIMRNSFTEEDMRKLLGEV
ncbi:MAG: hypothetical protein ABH873_03665 [Candidatus Firestonebacteria bacterium]